MSEFDIRLQDPTSLSRPGWRLLQTIQRNACQDALDGIRTEEEIDTFVGWDKPDHYYDSHIDPNIEVGSRFSAGQRYSCPVVAVAYDGKWPIGFAYAANNVSGKTEQELRRKELTIVSNHLWLREVAVAPGDQGRRAASKLVAALLDRQRRLQPASLYMYPDEMPGLQAAAERRRFKVKGEIRDAQPFGSDTRPTRMIRMVRR